ncbi:conserved hypothetical protein [Candidatus Koribacter versatilis Ellin345]|uniref:Uncharacterized protein n=1 Tax=Koribacter versatilis (strain Ellin345) TaxID=204669 RepID=Q1IKN9_KORVE|nr:hypothetical protein [Candidatus Koribacter versatilis]ABF42561.1 conserved hypothetical protein [Candidatus Koribacter versatilis Ellin345]
MKASIFYRIASVLLVLFAVGHTLGFRQVDPKWGIDSLVSTMQSSHFAVQGFTRSYWDFYVGFGLFVSVLLLFAAVVAWQLGGLRGETLVAMRGVGWALAACFAVNGVLSWRYFFVVPVVFSAVIAVCLVTAAALSGRT